MVVHPHEGASRPAHDGLRVVVYVPHGAPVAIYDGCSGTYTIGDTHGPLTLQFDGGGTVTAGHVDETHIVVRGATNVRLTAVVGDVLDIAADGVPDIGVLGGRVDRLRAKLVGSGWIGYAGTARAADLTLHGPGNVHVNNVAESLQQLRIGSGRIRIDHPPPARSA
ncbi:GIN domain-containing protein [Actinophytocola sp.]|uniref:GIN domain-containing protein n=1 Tax=Actinophytocola sp. TaxID=1872138 RepID=UPI002ED5C948